MVGIRVYTLYNGIMNQMSIREVRADLADALNRVMYCNETIVITRHGKPVARIVPVGEDDPQDAPTSAGVGV